MSKTKFAQQYSKILAKTPIGRAIIADEDAWLRPILLQNSLYAKKISRADSTIVSVYRKFGPRQQKFLAIIEPSSSTEQVIAKGKLIEALWPSSKAKAKSQKSAVLYVMRSSVAEQIAEFRLAIKSQIKSLAKAGFSERAKALNSCQITGRSLNSCKTAVDHLIPFIKLAEDWLELSGFSNYEAVALKGKTFADADLLQNWQIYHKAEARLQMTCHSANSSANSRGYSSRF